MTYLEHGEGSNHITFLFKFVPGAADRSFGLNVARMAELPESVVNGARRKSDELAAECQKKHAAHRSRSVTAEVANNTESTTATEAAISAQDHAALERLRSVSTEEQAYSALEYFRPENTRADM